MPAKPNLLVLNGTCLDIVEPERRWIESLGVNLFAEQSYRTLDEKAIREVLDLADAIILPASVRSSPSNDLMTSARRLRVCAIAASGYEWLDVAAATKHGIVVTYAPGGDGAAVVADLTWGLLLASARQIVYHHNLLQRGDMTRGIGTGVTGKTLGIIGLGAIGKEVALRAAGFKMKVLAHDPFANPIFAAEHGIKLVAMDDVLRESDFISLHVRLSEETRGMIGERQLAMMKPTTIILNAARKELIDEAALVDAILNRRLAGAGLDDPPSDAGKRLFGHSNVVFATHIGNRGLEGMIAVFRTAVEDAVAVLRGERPKFIVNPDVYEKGLRPRWS
jgi:phosphoglycerate dehydrogenase-like enzyme